MASATYTNLVNLITPYINKDKAEEVLNRQLATCSATADNFSPDHAKAVKGRLVGAFSLFIPDKAKRDELVGKINAFA